MPANRKPNRRFELPSLSPINFSLTDGTDIPPPEEEPPPAQPEVSSSSDPASNGQSAPVFNVNSAHDNRGRATDSYPTSPVSTKGPSSIRRFLSRKSLNTNYTNGTNSNHSIEDVSMIDRPESSLSFTPSIAKKNGSWIKRLSSIGGIKNGTNLASADRPSVIHEDKQSAPRPVGPPPPKLPELSNLEARIPNNDDGSLGAEDMFKNIK